MQKVLIFFLSFLLIFFCINVYSNGPEFQIDLNSSYIWRGFDLNPSHKPVVQPSITYSFGDSGFAVNIWGSITFEDKALNELDLTLSYDFNINENFSLSTGIVHYGWYLVNDFDFKDDTSGEVYMSVGFLNLPLSPEVSVYYDFINGDGIYILTSIGYSLKLIDKYVVDLFASVGYNGGQWIGENGISDINFSASIPLKIGKISVTPSANFTFVLLDSVSRNDHLWIGASIVF